MDGPYQSMFELAYIEDQNCFLLAHFKYTKDSIQELISDIFPNMRVIYNQKNVVSLLMNSEYNYF